MVNLDKYGQFGYIWSIWIYMVNLDIYGKFGYIWSILLDLGHLQTLL